MIKNRVLPTGIGVIGCGNISRIYLENLTKRFKNTKVLAVSDIDIEKAKICAGEFDIPIACLPGDLLENPEIGHVLNLTIPGVHFETGLSVLKANKGLYMEKPLSIKLRDGEELISEAKKRGLPIGGAPDTFMGAAIKTAWKVINDGIIGQIIGASVFMMGGGPEEWHPNPGFFYKNGGGPVYDMGPYYLTSLVALLGPVNEVISVGSRLSTSRVIGSGPKKGTVLPVEIDTFMQSILTFRSGVIGTATFSFDTPGGSGNTPMEIHGSEGSLILPDPNCFGGAVKIRKKGSEIWENIPLINNDVDNLRGLGLKDMINSFQKGSGWAANGERQLHILEIIHGMYESSNNKISYKIKHQCTKPWL